VAYSYRDLQLHDYKTCPFIPVTVAGKESVEVPPGTLNSVLKQAGLKK